MSSAARSGRHRRWLVALVALAFAFTPARDRSAAAAASTAALGLPDCVGTPQVRPASITLTCADAGIVASGLTWTGWGAAFAAARGTVSANDCTPNCAAGHLHRFPVVLIADGRQRCPNGRPAYARLAAAWPGRSPDPGAAEPLVFPMPCGRR